jgi:hypothetical protein
MATKGLRANDSEFLRSVFDSGEVCRYDRDRDHDCGHIHFINRGFPAIYTDYDDKDLILVDHGDEFQIVEMYHGESSESVRFSYDCCDKEIEILLESVISDILPDIVLTLNGRHLCLNDPLGSGNVELCHDLGEVELIGEGLMYLFNDIESFIKKLEQVVERMGSESEEFSKDRFVALMTEKRCKSARK